MIPIYAAYFGYVNREFMKGRIANKMYKPLVGDIGKKRSGVVSFFFSVFIIRRYVLIVLPLVFIQYPAIQIQAMIFFQNVYLILYAVMMNMPHEQQ
jgi:hypothetical protein